MDLSPHRSSRFGAPIKLIVIHGDAGKSDGGTVAWIKDPKSQVSYHYLIGRAGGIYQFVPEEEKAWHAGKSTWPDCTVGNSVNASSIGVAFANDGTEQFKPEQYRAGAKLVAQISKRHNIPLHLIRGHLEVSPGRKTDPWQHFDWFTFFGELGLAR
jgi:N-acetylmuramoyl-L-alanine amidase